MKIIKNLYMQKALMFSVMFAAIFMVSMGDANAQDLTNTISRVKGHFPSIAEMFSIVCYIVAIALAIKGVLAFKEHNEAKGQVPISKPIILIVVAVALLALPTVMSTGKNTIFGSGASGTSLDGGGLRNIN